MNFLSIAYITNTLHYSKLRLYVTSQITLVIISSRVLALLEGSGNVVLGGESDRDDLYIAPTIITDVNPDDPIMQEEVG